MRTVETREASQVFPEPHRKTSTRFFPTTSGKTEVIDWPLEGPFSLDLQLLRVFLHAETVPQRDPTKVSSEEYENGERRDDTSAPAFPLPDTDSDLGTVAVCDPSPSYCWQKRNANEITFSTWGSSQSILTSSACLLCCFQCDGHLRRLLVLDVSFTFLRFYFGMTTVTQ